MQSSSSKIAVLSYLYTSTQVRMTLVPNENELSERYFIIEIPLLQILSPLSYDFSWKSISIIINFTK